MRLCFLLLPDAKPLTARALEKGLKEFPELGKVSGFSSTTEGTASFTLGKLSLTAALMPEAVPGGEAEEATDRSLSGLDGSWTLPEHRAHLVVVQQGDKAHDVDELITFTRVVATLVRALGAVGVYWGAGGATHHPEFVVNIAHSELPLPLWVGVSLAAKKGGHELLSVGMPQLGLPDLALWVPEVDGQALEFFYDLLAYVARRGTELPEGDSVGRTDKERLKVTYGPSPVNPKALVWNVALPSPKKAKKKKPAAKQPKKAPAKRKKK